jgi:hypothetical protein
MAETTVLTKTYKVDQRISSFAGGEGVENILVDAEDRFIDYAVQIYDFLGIDGDELEMTFVVHQHPREGEDASQIYTTAKWRRAPTKYSYAMIGESIDLRGLPNEGLEDDIPEEAQLLGNVEVFVNCMSVRM